MLGGNGYVTALGPAATVHVIQAAITGRTVCSGSWWFASCREATATHII